PPKSRVWVLPEGNPCIKAQYPTDFAGPRSPGTKTGGSREEKMLATDPDVAVVPGENQSVLTRSDCKFPIGVPSMLRRRLLTLFWKLACTMFAAPLPPVAGSGPRPVNWATILFSMGTRSGLPAGTSNVLVASPANDPPM